MKKARIIQLIIALLFVSVTVTVNYTVYDNSRFILKEQDVILERLPETFDNYRIVQISDLHGKYFGENQAELLEVINALDYDAVIFTGDMNKFGTDDLTSSQAVLDLINGIENMDVAIWVDGNTGPFAGESFIRSNTGQLTEIGMIIEQAGVTVLTDPVQIIKDDACIWFVPDLYIDDIKMNYIDLKADNFVNTDDYNDVISHGKSLYEWYRQLYNNGEVKIRIAHYPIDTAMNHEYYGTLGHIDYDLSISGHYHGGQIRLPFIGALYIPSPNGTYFPKQNEVEGLAKLFGFQQYISAGLGASATTPLFAFRFFNTPEINLITLRCQ